MLGLKFNRFDRLSYLSYSQATARSIHCLSALTEAADILLRVLNDAQVLGCQQSYLP